MSTYWNYAVEGQKCLLRDASDGCELESGSSLVVYGANILEASYRCSTSLIIFLGLGAEQTQELQGCSSHARRLWDPFKFNLDSACESMLHQ